MKIYFSRVVEADLSDPVIPWGYVPRFFVWRYMRNPTSGIHILADVIPYTDNWAYRKSFVLNDYDPEFWI